MFNPKSWYRAISSQVYLLMAFALPMPLVTLAQNWEKAYSGNDDNLLYYPDRNAVYVRYGWENNKKGILAIHGRIPQARYFSYNLYDDRTKGSLISLADYQVRPDEKGGYSIYVVPESLKGSYPNQLVLPDSVQFTSVFIRYYLSASGDTAGVPLPVLEWMEGDMRKPPPPSLPVPTPKGNDAAKLEQIIRSDPKRITSKERKILSSPTSSVEEKERIVSKVMTVPIFKHAADPGALSAYNYNASGNYPNKDNHYIVMPVNWQKGQVLLVRFRPPTYATALGDTTKEVRYFSLSQGNEYTNTSITMHDAQLQVSSDGYVYVVVADEDAQIRAKAKELGINFMPKLYKDRLVLILRHMLPSRSFANSTREVPLFNNSTGVKGQEAQKTIGGFALIGKFIRTSDFRATSGPGQFGF